MDKRDEVIKIGGTEYLRTFTTATAKLSVVDETKVPTPIRQANRAVASNIHWQNNDNPDLVWVQFLLDSEGDNANWDYMPRPALVQNHATAIYKPMDMDHIIKEGKSLVYMDKMNPPPVHNTIFGVMTHTALVDADANLLTDEEITNLENTDKWDRPIKDRVCVAAWAALYSFLFPQTVSNLLDTIENGSMKVSMERWISNYDFLVREGDELKSYSRAEADKNGMSKNWTDHKPVNGSPIWRRSLSFIYGGVASTTNPANSLSRFIEQSVVKAAANVTPGDNILDVLLNRHSEIHRAFAVSSSEQEKNALISEHTRITQAIAAYTR